MDDGDDVLVEEEQMDYSDCEMIDDHLDNVVLDEPFNLDSALQGFKEHFCLFVIKLQEKHALPRKIQTTVMDEFKFLLEFFSNNYGQLIKSHLTNKGYNIEDDDELNELLGDDNVFLRSLECVSSDYEVIKFFTDHLDLVKPVDITLGKDSSGKPETYQYVPLLDVLRNYLKQDDVWSSFCSGNRRSEDSDFLSDYVDGELCKTHPLFSKGLDVIRIHLYNDEFEIVNPLGSKKKIHKISAFYFTIGNLECRFRSQLKHINLLLLVPYRHIQSGRYSYSDVLRPFIADLKVLATDGIVVEVGHTKYSLLGGLATVSCDNLSAHSLGGFSCCFSSGRICRFCMTTYEQINKLFSEDDVWLRNSQSHLRHQREVLNDPKNSRLYGVKSICPFQQLEYFDVTKSFPPDVMHDLLEGVVPLVMKKLIQELIAIQFLKLTELNDCIKTFPYSPSDKKCRPIPIAANFLKDGALVGTASEKWCLFRLFPFIISSSVGLPPQQNKHWMVYLQLREIIEIVLAPTVCKSWLGYLRMLIRDFLESFSKFGSNFTPKVHFMLHYPRLIGLFGSLRALWCMRFEGESNEIMNILLFLAHLQHRARKITCLNAPR
jgi:hypothetical protein